MAVAQKVAEDMGCELKIVDISFENLLTNMGRGDVDFVMAAMELNEERPNAADYSDPYYQDQAPLIVVKKGKYGRTRGQFHLSGGFCRQDRGRPDRHHQGGRGQ